MTPLVEETERIAILAHGGFPADAKTATGVMRYGDYEVAAVLDRDRAGDRVHDYDDSLPDAPIVGSFAAVEGDVNALLIGIAPIGGGFDESWRSDVLGALEAGCDVISGLHYHLADDAEFADLAATHGAQLHDVRKPHPDQTVAQGTAGDVAAEVVLTVGTDCSVGKMTTTMELVEAAEERGIDAGFIPTGQTGIMVAGWGTPIDRVISDFTTGAVEEMILERGDEHDVLFVEGQGSIVHPAYSAVTCGILHGSMADKLVLVHDADREAVHGYESFPLPPVESYVDLYESLAAPVHETEVAAGTLNTSSFERDAAAREALDAYTEAIDAPATDVIRFDAGDVLDDLLEA